MKYSEKALEFAKKAHKGQKDKAGMDYIMHLFMVASLMDTDEEKTVAYLHDVVEDTKITINDLNETFPAVIVKAVDAITKREKETYEDYLKRVSENELAKKVKVSDLLHNSDLTRLKIITEKDRNRAEKYKRAIIYLLEHRK